MVNGREVTRISEVIIRDLSRPASGGDSAAIAASNENTFESEAPLASEVPNAR